MSTTISKKHYLWMRALGITAIVCVFLLFTFIMFESSLDSSTSSALTQKFYDLSALSTSKLKKSLMLST